MSFNDERPELPSPGVKRMPASMPSPPAEQRFSGSLSSARTAACAWHEDARGQSAVHAICPACVEEQVTAFEAAAEAASRRRTQSLDAARPRLRDSALTVARSRRRWDSLVAAGTAD